MDTKTQSETTYNLELLSIKEIAKMVLSKGLVNNSSKPYAEAMLHLETIDDNYYHDSGKEIVLRFLVNSSHVRGEFIRDVKKELNNRLAKFAR